MTRASAKAAAKTAATKPQKALKKPPKDVLAVVPCNKTVLAAKMAEVATCEKNVVAARMELKARELELLMAKNDHDRAVHTHGGDDVVTPVAPVAPIWVDPRAIRPGESILDFIRRQ